MTDPRKVLASRQASVLRAGPVQTHRPDRSIATAPPAALNEGQAQNKTEIYTYFTKVRSGKAPDILYNGDRLWAKVTLTLENAGPVAVGNKSQITPVLSGKGELLQTDEPRSFWIGKGTRLYIAATTVNRVKVEVEPIPWLEQMSGVLSQLAGVAAGMFGRLMGGTK